MKLNRKWNGAEVLLALGAVLVSLKLLGVITWAWWIAILPLVIGATFGTFELLALDIVTLAALAVMWCMHRRSMRGD